MNTQQIEQLYPIYTPTSRPMEIVGFGSGAGSNLQALLKIQDACRFRIRALFTDRKSNIPDIAKKYRIPCIYFSYKKFIEEQSGSCQEKRDQYDRQVVRLIQECARQNEFHVDLVILAGYMRIVQQPLLQSYTLINVHPGDLAALDPSGQRKYTGSEAIKTALLSGEKRTRSAVHLVTQELDGGAVIVSGPWVSYTGCMPPTSGSLNQHQERQKQLSDWPALTEAVELIAQGRVSKDLKGNLYLDEKLLPREGVVKK